MWRHLSDCCWQHCWWCGSKLCTFLSQPLSEKGPAMSSCICKLFAAWKTLCQIWCFLSFYVWWSMVINKCFCKICLFFIPYLSLPSYNHHYAHVYYAHRAHHVYNANRTHCAHRVSWGCDARHVDCASYDILAHPAHHDLCNQYALCAHHALCTQCAHHAICTQCAHHALCTQCAHHALCTKCAHDAHYGHCCLVMP